MTTTDGNGVVFLEETDPISPFHTLMNTLQQGTSDAITSAKVRPSGKSLRNVGLNTTSGEWTLNPAWSSDVFLRAGVTRSGSSLVVPEAGVYLVVADATWANNPTGRRGIAISINGSTSPSADQGLTAAAIDAPIHSNVTAIWNATAGTQFGVLLYQNAGGTLVSTNILLSVARIA